MFFHNDAIQVKAEPGTTGEPRVEPPVTVETETATGVCHSEHGSLLRFEPGPLLRIVGGDTEVLDSAVSMILTSMANLQFEPLPGMNTMQWLRTALLHRQGMYTTKVFVVLLGLAMMSDVLERWLWHVPDAAHPRLAAALDSYANLSNTTGALRAFLIGAPDPERAMPALSTLPPVPTTHDFQSCRLVARAPLPFSETVRWLAARFTTYTEDALATDAATAGITPLIIVPLAPDHIRAGESKLYSDSDNDDDDNDRDVDVRASAGAGASASASVGKKLVGSQAPQRFKSAYSLPWVKDMVTGLTNNVHVTHIKHLMFQYGPSSVTPRAATTAAVAATSRKQIVKLEGSHSIETIDILARAFLFEVARGTTGTYPRDGVTPIPGGAGGFHPALEFARRTNAEVEQLHMDREGSPDVGSKRQRTL